MSSTWRAVLILSLVLVGLNLVIVALQSTNQAQESPDYSTYRTGAEGCQALFGALARLGFDVRRHERDLTEIPEDCGQLWVLFPTAGMSYEELQSLRDWVADGGQLPQLQPHKLLRLPGRVVAERGRMSLS